MNKDLHLLGQLTTELLINAEEFGDGCLGTAGTLVPEDVEMLTRVEAFCQEPKIWVVTQDEVIECEISHHEPQLFLKYDDALAFFNDCVWDADHDFTERGWERDASASADGCEHFEMWDANESYVYSHYSISLVPITLK